METSHVSPSVVLEPRDDAEHLGHIQPMVVLGHNDALAYSTFIQPAVVLDTDPVKTHIGTLTSVVVLEAEQPPPPFKVGDTLAYRNDTWTNEPTSFAIRWLRNGVPISGATGSTYPIPSEDKGATIAVEVTAVNASGSSEPVVSEYVGPIETNTMVL